MLQAAPPYVTRVTVVGAVGMFPVSVVVDSEPPGLVAEVAEENEEGDPRGCEAQDEAEYVYHLWVPLRNRRPFRVGLSRLLEM